jgi:hypothetical protein
MEEINRGKRFTVVDEIGPGTLILRGAVLDIISRVPPEMAGNSQIYLANVGEATLVMELIDARTGEVQALVSERRAMSSSHGQLNEFSMPTNSATVMREVKIWARNAASKLRVELDKAMKN